MPQTREQAQNNVRLTVQETLPEADAVPANTNGHVLGDAVAPMEAHPLAHLAGKYNEEPLWDDFLQAMQDVREQMNAEEDAAEHTIFSSILL